MAEAADLTGHAVHLATGEVPGPKWFGRALARFRAEIGDKDYPCYFGRRALQHDELYCSYAEPKRLDRLAGQLRGFLDFAATQPARRNVFATFFPPVGRNEGHDVHERSFWEVLQYLHDHDVRPWPADISERPDEPEWEFSFHGAAMFVFAAAPTHRLRRSRNLGPGLVMLFQPRGVFRGIEGGTPAGAVARRRIRDKLLTWDSIESHPVMGSYGDPSNFEWKQYFIADTAAPSGETCPLRMHQPVS